MRYARRIVSVTVLPDRSVAFARSETKPGPAGCRTVAVQPPPLRRNSAGRQVCPSSKDTSTASDRVGFAGEPACACVETGKVNVRPAGAVLALSSFGVNRTADTANGVRTSGGVCADSNSHAALTLVDSVNGAPRDTVA